MLLGARHLFSSSHRAKSKSSNSSSICGEDSSRNSKLVVSCRNLAVSIVFVLKCIAFFAALLQQVLICASASEVFDLDGETKCVSCIESAISNIGIDTSKKCDGYYCGKLQFSYTYWAEAGKPATQKNQRDFEKCARERECSELTVKAYFRRFKRDCNNDIKINCLDLAALHKAGPSACASDWLYKSRYWQAFNKTQCVTGVAVGSQTALLPDNSDLQQMTMKVLKNESLTSDCLDCICEALPGCNSSTVAPCGSGVVCGPFSISQAYWKDGKRPGASWTSCARTKECSSVTVKNYMEKYKKDCNHDGFITCQDYAAIHRRGPRACNTKDLARDPYWTKFTECLSSRKPPNDANTVKLEAPTQEIFDGIENDRTLLAISISSSTITTTTTTTTTAMPLSGSEYQQTTMPDYLRRRVSIDKKFQNNQQQESQQQHPHRNSQNWHSTSSSSSSSNIGSLPVLSFPNVREKVIVNPSHTMKPLSLYPIIMESSSNIDQSNLKQQQKQQLSPSITSTPHESVYLLQKQQPWRLSPPPTTLPPLQIQETQAQSQPGVTEATQQPLLEEDDSQTLAPEMSSTKMPLQPTVMTTTHQPQVTQIATAWSETRPQSERAQQQQLVLSSESNQQLQQQFANQHQSSIYGDHQLMPDKRQQHQQPQAQQHQQQQQTDHMQDFPIPSPDIDRVVTHVMEKPDFSNTRQSADSSINKGSSSMPRKPQPLKNNISSSSPSSLSLLSAQSSLPSATFLDAPSIVVKSPLLSTGSRSQQSTPGGSSTESNKFFPNFDQRQPPAMSSSISNMLQLDASFRNESLISTGCLECICDASSNCDTSVQCISKQREKNRCGLYMISWNQFQESEISLFKSTSAESTITNNANNNNNSIDEKMYLECTTSKDCAEKLIYLYIEKHEKDCNNDGKIDCNDVAAIHRVGPDQCNSDKFLGSRYWKDFKNCYANLADAPTH